MNINKYNLEKLVQIKICRGYKSKVWKHLDEKIIYKRKWLFWKEVKEIKKDIFLYYRHDYYIQDFEEYTRKDVEGKFVMDFYALSEDNSNQINVAPYTYLRFSDGSEYNKRFLTVREMEKFLKEEIESKIDISKYLIIENYD